MTPDELRRRAESLDDGFAARRSAPAHRHEETIVGEIPAGHGLVLRMAFAPAEVRARGALFLQFFRVCANGTMRSVSGELRIDVGQLPGVAAGVALACELAEQHIAAGRSQHRHDGDRRPEEQHANGASPAPRASTPPTVTTPPATTDQNGHEQQPDPHHNDAA